MINIRIPRHFVIALSMLACSSVACSAEQAAQANQSPDAKTVTYSIRITPPNHSAAHTFSVSSVAGTSAAIRTGEAVAYRQSCEQGKITMSSVDTGLRVSVETTGVTGAQVRSTIGAQLTTLTGMRSVKNEACEIDLPDTKNVAGSSQLVLRDGVPLTVDLGEIGSLEVTARISSSVEAPGAKAEAAEQRSTIVGLLSSIDARLASQEAFAKMREAEKKAGDLALMATMGQRMAIPAARTQGGLKSMGSAAPTN